MTRPWEAVFWNTVAATQWLAFAWQRHSWEAGAVGTLQLGLSLCMLFIRVPTR
jgi:hypothetical protein